MSVELKSTKAKVRDSQRVREVLDTYDVNGVEIELYHEGQEWLLGMTFKITELDYWEWPTAIHSDLWPSKTEHPDDEGKTEHPDEEDEWEPDEWDDLHEQQGEEGFLSLLRDLTPFLETPLLILVIGGDYGSHAAYTWMVLPGNKEIEKLDISV